MRSHLRVILLALLALCVAPLRASADMSDAVRWVRTDYYGALNVSKSANATEIKSKYRRLALQYHPDKLGHLTKSQQKSAEKIFKVIAEGKEVLTDPERRAEYDDTIAMLPSFARPKWGKKSVFDAEHVKVSVASVLTGFATFAVIFASVNQRANQASDRGSIVRSQYYRQRFKAAQKADKKRWGKEPPEAYFETFMKEEGVVFVEGWKHTVIGKLIAAMDPRRLWKRKENGPEEEASRREEAAAAAAAAAAAKRKGGKKGGHGHGGGGAPKMDATRRANKEREQREAASAQRAREDAAEAEIARARAAARRASRVARFVASFDREGVVAGEVAEVEVDRRADDAEDVLLRGYLIEAGFPEAPKEIAAAVEEEAHFAEKFDAACERAAREMRAARAKEQEEADLKALETAADEALRVEGEDGGGSAAKAAAEAAAAAYDPSADEDVLAAERAKAEKKEAAKREAAARAAVAKAANKAAKEAAKK